MFIGHYGPALLVKRLQPDIPLWVLFIAVQFVDVLWSVFVWIGIEKVRIVPGITATNPLDLYYMPYTHSLVGSVGWAVAAGVAYALLRHRSHAIRVGVAVAVAVLSHWFLDLLVHRPDLPLFDNTMKVGFGLWNYPGPAFALEIGSLLLGLIVYLRYTHPLDGIGRIGPWLFALVLICLQSIAFFGAPPQTPTQAAAMALTLYAVIAATIAWLERHRRTRAQGAIPRRTRDATAPDAGERSVRLH
jgi:hypothetical protein